MTLQSRKRFPIGIACLVLFAAFGFASDHHSLNGTWAMVPAQGDYEGHPVIQSGTVTIEDREHNIYISRNFTYDGANESMSYHFSTDGSENSTIHNGKTFKSKAKWDGHILKVTTTEDNSTTVERYNLQPDGTMVLVVERPSHKTMTLLFHHQ
jgi:hypothetical protein